MNDDKPYFLFNGDALALLRSMPDNSVDSIVTDPPAGIGWMGNDWDKADNANQFIDRLADIMAEGLRVLKPGGHALVWALPRTSHWTAWALDEAGFEIRDKIYNLFGGGLPKSHNLHDEWEGWGTSLRPAAEEWILCRKPLDGTIAANAMKWGVGALNIEASRIPVDDEQSDVPGRWPANVVHDGSDEVLGRLPTAAVVKPARAVSREHELSGDKRYNDTGATSFAAKPGVRRSPADSAARFFYCSKITKADRDEGLDDFEEQAWVQFQTANGTSGKPSSLSKGRNTAYRNIHPTPKSTKLMRWLCRLITPPGGVVLDMFAGSGSTGKAAILEGFRFVGSENKAEYYEIAVARLDDAVMRAGAPVQQRLFEEM